MATLIERLTSAADILNGTCYFTSEDACREAADALTAKDAEIDRLRAKYARVYAKLAELDDYAAALRGLLNVPESFWLECHKTDERGHIEKLDAARAALAKHEGTDAS